MLKHATIVIAALGLVAACGKKDKEGKAPPATDPGSGSAAATGSGSATEGSAAGSGSAAAPAASVETVGDKTIVKAGFSTPESVLYDADADNYLVSNINGAPTDADDNGFITRIAPDGKPVAEKWIDGAKDDVKLDAPKGMAIVGGVLYVADITVVRRFDAKTGAQQADIPIEGATFLNDVAPTADGGVLVTDSGLDAKFQGTGADAIYKIDKAGKVTPFVKGKELGAPNGVLEKDGTVWMCTFGSGEVVSFDGKGKKTATLKPPKGQLDGLVATADGALYVTSWEGKAVYKLSGKDTWTEVVKDVEAPADMGHDPKRNVLMIPQFNANQVVIVKAP